MPVDAEPAPDAQSALDSAMDGAFDKVAAETPEQPTESQPDQPAAQESQPQAQAQPSAPAQPAFDPAEYQRLQSEYDKYKQDNAHIQGYLQHIMPQLQEYAEWKKNQKAQVPAAEQPKEWWDGKWQKPAESLTELTKLVTTDANGKLVPADGAPFDAVQRFNAAREQYQKFHDRLYGDTPNFLAELVTPLIRQEAQKLYQEQMAQSQQQSQVKQIVEQHADLIYQKDANGQPVMTMGLNPVTNRWEYHRAVTKFGQQYAEAIKNTGAMGISDPTQQHNIALGQLALQFLTTQGSAAVGNGASQPSAPASSNPMKQYEDAAEESARTAARRKPSGKGKTNSYSGATAGKDTPYDNLDSQLDALLAG